jgi:amphi-Trp domain-containing protein
MAKKDGAKSRRSERFEVEDTLSAPDVAGYLEAVARGLREGAVVLGEQGESLTVSVSRNVDFEVAAKRSKRKARVRLTLSFRQEKPAEAEADGNGPEQVPVAATIPDEMSF